MDEILKKKLEIIEKMAVGEAMNMREDFADEVPDVPGAWGFAQVWNKAVMAREQRERVPRDYVYASELGKPLIDIYLNLRNEPYTNVPNARSLRKFEAGNIFEWIVKLVLVRAGILVASQQRCEKQYADCVRVSGRIDFIAGGNIDYDQARQNLDYLMMPDVFIRAGEAIISYLADKYPNGLDKKIIEVKSTSSFMFENYLRMKKGSDNHHMQDAFYLDALKEKNGELLYICRDDLRLFEVPITNPGKYVDMYKERVYDISKMLKDDRRPDIEPLIMFDADLGKFTKNWGVEYSQYLTLLYGFSRPDEYSDTVSPAVSRFNRVMGRLKQGKTMTKLNLAALDEMKSYGFVPDEIAARYTVDPDEVSED